MNHIIPSRGECHDAVPVRVVVTVPDGLLSTTTTLVGRLTNGQAVDLICQIRRYLASGGDR